IAVPGAGYEDDIGGPERGAGRRRDGTTVAPQRALAFGPDEQVAVVVGIGEREHDAEDGTAAGHQADGHRAAAAPFEVIARAVVRVHEPGGRTRLRRSAAPGLLAEVAARRKRLHQARADEELGLGVGLGLVAVASRPARPVKVAAQVVPGFARGGYRYLEGAAEVDGGHRDGSGVVTAAARPAAGRNSRQATTGCGG